MNASFLNNFIFGTEIALLVCSVICHKYKKEFLGSLCVSSMFILIALSDGLIYDDKEFSILFSCLAFAVILSSIITYRKVKKEKAVLLADRTDRVLVSVEKYIRFGVIFYVLVLWTRVLFLDRFFQNRLWVSWMVSVFIISLGWVGYFARKRYKNLNFIKQ